MRKVFSFIAVLLIATMASAQAIENGKFFENTYVTLEGGGLTPMEGKFFGDMRPTVGIEVGKNVTPVVGFSAEWLNAVNTTGVSSIFDQYNLVGNVKFNMSNWIGGYQGEPRKVEVSLVPGMGWGHDYSPGAGKGYNFLTYNAFTQVDFNIGENKAWQINVKPGVVFAARNGTYGPHKDKGAGQMTVGVTYKFKSKRTGSHNFVVCPFAVTQEDYDSAVEDARKFQEVADRLKADNDRLADENEQLRNKVPDTVFVSGNQVMIGSAIVTFGIGQTELSDVEKVKLKSIASQLKDQKVKVIGSADLSTGSRARNEYLAKERSENVTQVLVDMGINVIETVTVLDANENAEASRAAIIEVTQ